MSEVSSLLVPHKMDHGIVMVASRIPRAEQCLSESGCARRRTQGPRELQAA